VKPAVKRDREGERKRKTEREKGEERTGGRGEKRERA